MPRGKVQAIRIQKVAERYSECEASRQPTLGMSKSNDLFALFADVPFCHRNLPNFTPRRARLDQKEDLTANQVLASGENHQTERTISQEGEQYNNQIGLMKRPLREAS